MADEGQSGQGQGSQGQGGQGQGSQGQASVGLRGKSELTQRAVSASVMAVAAIAIAWYGSWPFALVWCALAAAVAYEWLRIVRLGSGSMAWLAIGVVYAALLALCTILVRGQGTLGFVAILYMFAVVWMTDIGAYFAGRTFGGPKFAPAISPKKTWSGVIGGLLAGTACSLAVLKVAGVPIAPAHVVLSLVLGIAVVFGDLFESFLKRRFGVKDAGSLIPGHGGFLDRLDGFIAAIIVAALVGVLRGGWANVPGGLLTW